MKNKKVVGLTEDQLRNIITEAVIKVIDESSAATRGTISKSGGAYYLE